MLNIYLSPQGNAQKYKKFLSKNPDHHISCDAKILQNYQRRKLIISPEWSPDIHTALHHCESGCFIEETIHEAETHIEKSLSETSDLYLVLTTKTLYEQGVTPMLINFLKARGCKKGLVEIFATVLQELITNAVIHGNLGLDLYMNNILNPPEFNPDQAEQLQEVFVKIQSMLNDPNYGQKPVMLRINCFEDTLTLDIQDQGNGFDFEEFQKKYHDTKFVKGMDMVFLMSKDIDYDLKTKTTSIILEDPDKAAIKEPEIHPAIITLGVFTTEQDAFEATCSVLIEEEFKNIKHIHTGEEGTLNGLDLLLILSDITPENMLASVKQIRKRYAPMTLPILCQKSENMPSAYLKELSQYSNDFLSTDRQSFEWVSRIKALLGMKKAQQGFTNFYTHYQSEIAQSKNTIKHFETIDPLILKNTKNEHKFSLVLNATQTRIENTNLQAVSQIPYGNGFSFSCHGHDYFVFISMRNGLSSILVVSYLKGYIDHFEKGEEHFTLAQIIQEIHKLAEEILPLSVELNIFCISWDRAACKFQHDQKGDFSILKHSTKNNTTRPVNKNINTINSEQIIYIFEATAQSDIKNAIIAGEAQNIKIPTLMISPCKDEERTK